MSIKDNRMFSQMMTAAVARLTHRDWESIADKANIEYDAGRKVFLFRSLNSGISVSLPDFNIDPDLEGWHQLVILHYMDLADGMPPANRSISFSQMKDGFARGSGFDRDCESAIQEILKTLSEAEFMERCRQIGGREIDTNADFSAVFPFLPNFPVTLKVWFADDEFDASGRMMLDAAADHYLTIEDAVTVGSILLDKLRKTDDGEAQA